MPEMRHIAAALAGAFVVGTVAGGILLGGGGSAASGTAVPFNPAAEKSVAVSEAAAAPKAKAKAAGAFTATAVNQGDRIILKGDGAEPGAKLVVQRKEADGWQDFPARAVASSSGSYSTYIITSRDGTFRLKDTGSDAASEPVDVRP